MLCLNHNSIKTMIEMGKLLYYDKKGHCLKSHTC